MHIEALLTNKFPYYRKLSREQQGKFIERIQNFIAEKEFAGRQDLVVTDEMRVLISAAAIQVTFGLENYMLDNFGKIFIYPGEYKSRITGLHHKGEVNLAGIIALSWPDFVEGYRAPDNNRNLGLHEMAHAVRFDKFKGEYDHFFSEYFEKWARIAKSEFQKVRDTDAPSIFREYAGSNMNEFFAVCTEHFFETPQAFKQELPELYHHTCILLNQDPSMDHYVSGVRNMLLGNRPRPVHGNILYRTNYNTLPIGVLVIYALFSFLPSLNSSDKSTSLFIFSILLVPAAIIANYFVKRFTITDNGIEVRSRLVTPFSPVKAVPYDLVISAEMREYETIDGNHNSHYSYGMEVKYIYKGEIHTYEVTEQAEQLRKIGEYLHSKKVAVKVFSEKLRWY